LLDCADGELARWSGRTSAAGVYLDGIGHYLGETALLAGLGIRAQGHLALSGGYVTAGLAAAVLAALVKAETDQVIVARAKAGLPGGYGDAALAPRAVGLARARRLAAALKVHRAIQAVELSLLILVAAVIDAVHGGLAATRAQVHVPETRVVRDYHAVESRLGGIGLVELVVPVGTRLAQIIILPNLAPQVQMYRVRPEDLPGSDRGTNGFGSTG